VLDKGPAGPPLLLANIAAITFTEKAAGEMKVRLRQELEPRAADAGTRGERARQALRDLEVAAISTFHAFAVALLKERPVEAGLDPRFTALDEIQNELLFKEVWEGWLAESIRQRREPIERTLRAGLRLRALRDLARTLRLNTPIVRELTPKEPPSDEEIRARLKALRAEGEAHSKNVFNSQDKLAECLTAALTWLAEETKLRASENGVKDSVDPGPGRDTGIPQHYSSRGAQRYWLGGRDAIERVRDFVARVIEISRARRQRLLYEVDRWLVQEFLPVWDEYKRNRGVLDFDDQLMAARSLLRNSPAARRDFQRQFATVLVDEFQDTDAIQLEIVLLLSSTDLHETDPARLRPAPGRLFIVGDPKQSIYRFRGADIETYLEVVDPERGAALGLERLELTTNFRSVPSILRFVDCAFSNVMRPPEDGRYQPVYLSFGGAGARCKKEETPAVHLLSHEPDENTAKDFIRREAARIAQLIAHIHQNEKWMIAERESGKTPAGEKERVPRYGDIAILLPVLTRVDALEDALQEAELPYILEGGKFYYARSEVTSALTVLRAVANPNDRVALYGALRSIFFGLSDEDLLRARTEGLPLDYRREVPQSSPLAHAYALLRELHARRHARSASETFEVLLRETGAREVLSARAGGIQSLANLNKLARTLRARQAEGTFSEVLDVLAAFDEEGLAESESRVMEERGDAVRIMTIHKAKGLDFPIVIIGGLGQERRHGAETFLADRHQRKFYAFSLGKADSGQSAGWRELAEGEKRRQDAELVRLLYVALTRARDHLILSTHCKLRKETRDAEPGPRFKGTRLEYLAEIISNPRSDQGELARVLEVGSLLPSPKTPRRDAAARNQDWIDMFRKESAQVRRLVTETPAARSVITPAAQSERAEDQAPEERMPNAARERSIRLGIAFHEAMEAADFGQEARIREWAEAAGARHRLEASGIQMVEEMMRTTLRSELIARARAAEASGARLWRELPFIRPVEGNAVEEGKIDLVFEDHGEWQIVDYKTDLVRGEDSVLQEKYRGQMLEYARALEAMGLRIKAAYLLLARTGRHIEIPLIPN
ncbi:MAG: UvrD-helicase domain-containing protein, partial [Gammaproteobacteria bacterium]